jgi:protein AaeX
MRFNEINLFGLYVAPITVVMGVAWVVYLVVRRACDRFGLIQRVWHPTLFELALYIMIVCKRDVTAAGHYAAIACEAARLHFHGSSSSIFVLG